MVFVVEEYLHDVAGRLLLKISIESRESKKMKISKAKKNGGLYVIRQTDFGANICFVSSLI